MVLTTGMLFGLEAQDVFDIIAWQLLRQRAKSIGDDGRSCRYRGPRARRCAIGWIIPDTVYHPNHEGRTVRDLARELLNTWYGDRFARFLWQHIDLLGDLQKMHDDRPVSAWPYELRRIALCHYLVPAVVDDCPIPFATHAGADHVSGEREETREAEPA
jgi:hypothetical protein